MIQLFNSIEGINSTNHGQNTQLTATEHENIVCNTFKDYFNAEEINKENFRNFIKKNGYSWCGQSYESINRSCPSSIRITNNSINLIRNKNYIVSQPSGGQNFPDCCLICLDNNDDIQLTMVECKQKKPKFNNNPPKMEKNCLYVCGNKIYNGYLLTTPEWQERKNTYIQRYRELVEEYTDEEMKPVLYKVIELNWGINGPKCFIERENQNIPLIIECLSRYLDFQQSSE